MSLPRPPFIVSSLSLPFKVSSPALPYIVLFWSEYPDMVSFSSKPIKDNFLISSKLNLSPFLNSKFSMVLLEFVTLASTTDFKITLSFGELLKDIFMSVKFEVVFISPFEFTL